MDSNRKGEPEAEIEADEGKSEMGETETRETETGERSWSQCKMTEAGLPIFI